MTCLAHVALLGINIFREVLFGVGSHEARPGSIIDGLDAAQPGGLDREAS